MRVMRTGDSAGGPVLVEASAPRPQPGPGELLIRVAAAGVTTGELEWYPTLYTKAGEKRSGAIPGHEFSGVIEAVGGDGGNNFAAGQEVFGVNDWFADGATAEYCLAPIADVALKPCRLTHADAASVPISALTAWQGLYVRANLQAGERVLINGGAGAVGIFAIQLAKLRGAHVTATASERNREFVAGLGADLVFDSRESPFEERAGTPDVIFDTVGGETLERSWSVLGSGGRVVTIAAGGESTAADRVKAAFFIVEPDRMQLTEIAGLLESGRLRTALAAVVPLSRAAEAYAGTLERSGPGKLVVELGAFGR